MTITADSMDLKEPMVILTDADRAVLLRAHRHLQHPNLAARLTSVVGTPVEAALRTLPSAWTRRLQGATTGAVTRLLDTAISSLPVGDRSGRVRRRTHRALGIGTGALGGFFGLPGLLVELPVTTTIMLRGIADIARDEGEDLDRVETRMACVQVFALGARSADDDAADTGYYGVRTALAWNVTSAMRHLAHHGVQGGPLMLNLISSISSRFGAALSQKAAAQMVPIVGAAGGALVNGIFFQHFQDMAWSHFSIRRLERQYGTTYIRNAYDHITRAENR